jgi:hypothetical protein
MAIDPLQEYCCKSKDIVYAKSIIIYIGENAMGRFERDRKHKEIGRNTENGCVFAQFGRAKMSIMTK